MRRWIKMYTIELDNGENITSLSILEVKKWIKENGCMVEPNADCMDWPKPSRIRDR